MNDTSDFVTTFLFGVVLTTFVAWGLWTSFGAETWKARIAEHGCAAWTCDAKTGKCEWNWTQGAPKP